MRKYLILLWVFVLLVSFCTLLQAQSLQVDFEEKGTYVCWIAGTNKDDGAIFSEPVRIQGEQGEINYTRLPISNLNDAVLWIVDRKTGNSAKIVLDGDEPVTVKSSDFEYVYNVLLRITDEDGAAVESALVTVTDSFGKDYTEVLTPADAGIVQLHHLGAGQLNVKVATKGLKKTLDSDIELPLERNSMAFQTDVRVSGDVNTISAPKNTTKSSSSKESSDSEDPPREQRSPTGTVILSNLVGLILLAMIAAIIYAILKSKGITAKDALQKMGVDTAADSRQPVPDQQIPDAPAVDPNICPFCGQQKDVSGNCACSLERADQPPASTSGSVFSPKLVGSQGVYAMHIFELAGAGVIGRDSAATYSLANDSTVSRKHATIEITGSECVIRDEGSSNGTFVNGEKIIERVLKPGDEVRVGETRFRYET